MAPSISAPSAGCGKGDAPSLGQVSDTAENRSRCSFLEAPPLPNGSRRRPTSVPGRRPRPPVTSSPGRLRPAAHVEHAVRVVEVLDHAQPGMVLVRQPRRSSRKMAESAVGDECMWTTSGMASRRCSVRSIDITGVIPLPPSRRGSWPAGDQGGRTHPGAMPSRTMVPASSRRTRCSERNPSGIALTVIVSSPSRWLRPDSRGRRTDRIGAPVPFPVDVDTDADVLSGLVLHVPAPARLDDQSGCVASLRG